MNQEEKTGPHPKNTRLDDGSPPIWGRVLANTGSKPPPTMESRRSQVDSSIVTESMATILDHIDKGILVIQSGRIVYLNPKMETLIGFSPDEIITKHWDDYLLNEKSHSPGGFRPSKAGFETRPNEQFEAKHLSVILTRHNGPQAFFILPLSIQWKKQPAVLMFITPADIDKATSQTNAISRTSPDSQFDHMSALAEGTALEIGKSLRIIEGYTELAVNRMTLDRDSGHYLNQVLVSCKRVRQFVQRLASLGQCQVRKFQPVLLDGIINEAVTVVRHTLPDRVELWSHVEKQAVPTLADPAQIHHLIMNLCRNAVEAMPSGGVLEVGLHQVSSDNHAFISPDEPIQLRLTVSDTGCGFSPYLTERIFTPFYTTKQCPSFGLGLTVVQGIVKLHNGSIRVHSSPGRGSTFQIYFPSYTAGTYMHHTPDPATGSFKKCNILLVDGSRLQRDLGVEILQYLGYEVNAPPTGKKALEILESAGEGIDLMIIDEILSDMSGFELARKAAKISPCTPIILYARALNSRKEKLAQEIGVSFYLEKPVFVEETAQLARSVIKAAS